MVTKPGLHLSQLSPVTPGAQVHVQPSQVFPETETTLPLQWVKSQGGRRQIVVFFLVLTSVMLCSWKPFAVSHSPQLVPR